MTTNSSNTNQEARYCIARYPNERYMSPNNELMWARLRRYLKDKPGNAATLKSLERAAGKPSHLGRTRTKITRAFIPYCIHQGWLKERTP